jgi:hypothetical protein
MTNLQTNIITELTKAGALFLVLGVAVYFLYNDNRKYQDQFEQRLIRVETMYYDCIRDNKDLSKKNFELLQEKFESTNGNKNKNR